MEAAPRHTFMSFDTRAELRESATELLVESLRQQRLVIYASPGAEDDVSPSLRERAGKDVVAERFITRPVENLHAAAAHASPREALEGSLTDDLDVASRRGLDGVTVLSLSTPLAGLPGWRQWEWQVGNQTARHRLSAICAYDGSLVDPEILADVATLHEELHTRRHTTPFRLYPTVGGLRLVGEIDATSAARLRRTLAGLDMPRGARVTIDVSDLDFISHDGLVILEEYARTHRVPLQLVGASATLQKLHQILGVDEHVLEVKP